MANNVNQIVTDRIVAEMEKGIIPWNKPWFGSKTAAISRSTGKPYSLLNQMLLGRPGEYATFDQIKKAGGKVRKGEKASLVTFWKQVKIETEEVDPETGKPIEKLVPMLRYYQVFNLDQCEGIEPKFYKAEEIEHTDPIAEAEAVIDNYIAASHVKFESRLSDEAYYSPVFDNVVVPIIDQYKNPEEYYSTAFHELTHSTGHRSRLNRFTGNAAHAAFGSSEYSKEELVAELGSAFLMNHCGINTEATERNSAAYLQAWLKALKSDANMIVSAASKAEKAADYILA